MGFKICFITIGFGVTLGTSALPLLPLLGNDTLAAQTGYATVMVILYGTFPGIYAVVAAAVADAFGPVHYKANFGLLFTQAVVYSAAILTATQVYISYSDYSETKQIIYIPIFRFQLYTRLWDTMAYFW